MSTLPKFKNNYEMTENGYYYDLSWFESSGFGYAEKNSISFCRYTHNFLKDYFLAKEKLYTDDLKKRISSLEDKIKKLEFMVENGLGYEDLKNEVI